MNIFGTLRTLQLNNELLNKKLTRLKGANYHLKVENLELKRQLAKERLAKREACKK
ncbi:MULTISPECIES: hypothetical protein [Bacillus cereus group]|uniref:hypothetical protein n=1 Tax=Bacillus cereus group TaxID=86661 RepID=UPI001596483A|nr:MULTISPECIES: hypothetical protein [Bacillus cereus group]